MLKSSKGCTKECHCTGWTRFLGWKRQRCFQGFVAAAEPFLSCLWPMYRHVYFCCSVLVGRTANSLEIFGRVDDIWHAHCIAQHVHSMCETLAGPFFMKLRRCSCYATCRERIVVYERPSEEVRPESNLISYFFLLAFILRVASLWHFISFLFTP